MATVVYGREGDQVIITRIDFGYGDEYLVECLNGYGGYATVYASFNFDMALAYAQSQSSDRRFTNA